MELSRREEAAARKQLELLAEHGRDPRVKEMARDVLAGKSDLRATMLGSKYEDALNDGMASFAEWQRSLSDDERAEQLRRATEYLEQTQQEQPRRSHRPPVEEDDWESPGSVLRKEPPRR